MNNNLRNKVEQDSKFFQGIKGINISRFFPGLSIILIILLIFCICAMFLPWQQTSVGNGVITVLNPEDRVQHIIAPVSGRVKAWYVRDGMQVHKGDKIVDLIDIDPNIIHRLQTEVTAMHTRLMAAESALELFLSNYNRQRRLYQAGLASKREYEVSGINYKKAISEKEYYKAELLKSQIALARQSSQVIYAPRSGYVISTLSSSDSKLVKYGDILATFLPNSISPNVVELYINGTDIPLVKVGQKVRLIFDGWPSVQFSGWPSVAIGTFGGVVIFIDYAANTRGLFRVLIKPDPNDQPWPEKRFLRLGAKAQGYIILNRVFLGYELWRKLNGFPISIDHPSAAITSNIEGIETHITEKNGNKD